MSETSKNLLETFKAKQTEKDTSLLQEARRLVNLYRSISCFGDEFVEQYNQLLLSTKPNIRRLLRNFMGGEEVESYLQFLEQNAHLSKGDMEQKNASGDLQIKGYLPDPSTDKTSFPETGKISISESEWKEMKEQKKALQEQTALLLKRLEKLEQNVSAARRGTSAPSSYENYSEIIEESKEKTHE